METVSSELDIPETLEIKQCCLDAPDETLKPCCYRYSLRGSIVHVDPMENEEEVVYGESKEGHYVTFTNATSSPIDKPVSSNTEWFEIDDDKVHLIDNNSNICNTLSGRESVSSKSQSKERRYAAMVIYSRVCNCCISKE